MSRSTSPDSSNSSDRNSKVFVGNLRPNTYEQEIRDVFEAFGRLRSFWVAPVSSSYAFIEYEDPKHAREAVEKLDGKLMCATRLTVQMSKSNPRTPRIPRHFLRHSDLPGGRRSRHRSRSRSTSSKHSSQHSNLPGGRRSRHRSRSTGSRPSSRHSNLSGGGGRSRHRSRSTGSRHSSPHYGRSRSHDRPRNTSSIHPSSPSDMAGGHRRFRRNYRTWRISPPVSRSPPRCRHDFYRNRSSSRKRSSRSRSRHTRRHLSSPSRSRFPRFHHPPSPSFPEYKPSHSEYTPSPPPSPFL